MHRHHQQRSRGWLGTLIVGIALSVMFLGSSPAQAAGHGAGPTPTPASTPASSSIRQAPATVAGPADAPKVGTRACRPAKQVGSGCLEPTPLVSEGGCGFLQRCIYLNRTEQRYVITGSQAIVTAAICVLTAVMGCTLATVVVDIAADWLRDRGGICSTSRPKLRIQYLPIPQVEGCVS